MDYKYINQLLERYWRCETSIEEEDILKAFFSQKDVPVELLRYKDLFTYELSETKQDVLGEDFDAKILAMTEESNNNNGNAISYYDGYDSIKQGTSMAMGDSAVVDSMKRSIADPQSSQVSNILK